jgi:CPA2 family monovalent cation:H+ antiporter-2
MVGLVVVGKTLIRTALVRLFRRPPATALLVGVGLAQIGEFSFVLVQVARSAGHVGTEVYNATLAASLLTILLNACLVRWVPRWLAPGRTAPGPAPAGPRGAAPVVLCGFGRVGSAVGEALETFGLRYTVVESDIDIVRTLRGRGIHAVFGDAGHRRVLEHAGADFASLLVVTVPEVEQARSAVRELRALNPAAPILARAHSPRAADGLRAAGATEVIQPELEAAGTLIRHALERLSLPRDAALDYLTRFRGALAEGVQAGRETAPALPRLHQVTVARGGLADLSLGEARVRERFGVTVVAVVRDGEEIHNPGAETILRAGDRVTVFGLPAQVAAFRKAAERPE